MITDPVKAVEAVIGQKLIGMRIDATGKITMTFERALLEITGEDFDAYIEVEEVN